MQVSGLGLKIAGEQLYSLVLPPLQCQHVYMIGLLNEVRICELRISS